jgi:hypothetical protein
MRRHLASCTAALAAVSASFGLPAAVAAAAGTATTTAPTPSTAAPATVPSTPTSSTTAPTTTSTTTSSTTAAPSTPAPHKPSPKPVPAVKSKATLYLPDAFFVHGQPVTVPGRGLHVGGVVRPYVPGQWVKVQVYLGRRLIKTDQLRIRPSRSRRFGRFTEKVVGPGPGSIAVKVTHARTSVMRGFLAERRIAALDEHVGFGSTGSFVALIQQRLAALHFYIPQSGVFDQQTGLAIDAYHRLLGHGIAPGLDGLTISELLAGRGAFTVRYPQDGTHVEGDLTHQVLALIYGARVYRLYPISSGKPSTPTILGRFSVYYRVPGYLPDGMYYSSFFSGGYAIHGFDPAPDYPASHGCMRLPISDAISVFNWLTYGDRVDVYYR